MQGAYKPFSGGMGAGGLEGFADVEVYGFIAAL